MSTFAGYEFAIGLAVGAIVVGATLALRLFRCLALGAAAGGLVYLYIQQGIVGLLGLGIMLRSDALAHPEFSYGLTVGALAAPFVGLAIRKSRSV